MLREIHRQRAYTPDWESIPIIYSPYIQNGDVKDSILTFIRHEFSEYIDTEDRIHTPPRVSPVTSLMRRLLDIAIIWGVERAVASFMRAKEDNPCLAQKTALIEGVTVNETIDGYDGIKLVRLPSSSNQLPPYLPQSVFGISSLLFLSATLLVVDCELSPSFRNPNSDKRQPQTRTIRSMRAPEFDADMFCKAMSLATNRAVDWPAQWTHYAPNELWHLKGSMDAVSLDHLPPRYQLPTVSSQDVAETRRLYEALVNLDTRVRDKLRVPISRWVESKRNIHPGVDEVIDLGIALECLYIPDNNDRELNYRLRLNSARFLGNSVEERKRIFENWGNYMARARRPCTQACCVREAGESRKN